MALRVARAWGSALGELEPLPDEQLAALLHTCTGARGQPGQQPENAGACVFGDRGGFVSNCFWWRAAFANCVLVTVMQHSRFTSPPPHLNTDRRAAADAAASGGVFGGRAWQGVLRGSGEGVHASSCSTAGVRLVCFTHAAARHTHTLSHHQHTSPCAHLHACHAN